jgi:hypothetical protein
MRHGRPLELLTTKAATINHVAIPCTSALALFLLAICPLFGATTHRVHAGQSGSMIQRVINGASSGDTVSFDAGTYAITSTLTLKCGLTYTGPAVTPATAEITTSTTNISLTDMSGGCTSGKTKIEYLHFNGAGPLYVDKNNYSHISFEYNQITSLPAEESCGQACESLFFDGNNNNSDSDITIQYNTFGDSDSCTAGINVDDGACAGILVNPMAMVNFTVKYNIFYHLQEGIHFYNVNYVVGNKSATCDNCDIEFNYFNAIHRIALEFQTNIVGHPAMLSNNVYGNPLNGYYGTLTQSVPCCQYGDTFGTLTTVVPADYVQNNVEINTLGPSHASPNGIEMAGTGTITSTNMIQGAFCAGIVWSFGANNWTIQDNIVQGPLMASRVTCPTSPIPSSFISAESGATYSPVISGNVTTAVPAAVSSAAPTIWPDAGSYTFPLKVKLIDRGHTSGIKPLGNTGIWYTTDGSTPVPGSGTAQYLPNGGIFTLPASATVKAVGMWGAPNQPSRYPAGYGFVPSAVKSAHYTSRVEREPRRPQ